jgi:hypothetical protein
MAGGLLQLAGYGNQDIYLTGSPLISFFKIVYRRYTNFSMESISLEMDKTELSFDQEKIFKRKIDRNADLVSKIYFSFTLPEIQSSNGTQFRWIKNIGTSIIRSVSFYIQGRKIDEHYGEWLNIWNELNLTAEQEKGYNEMIGNIPEIYDPANALGNNGIYPESDIDVDFIPSIKSYRLYVPLIFWFNRHPGLALPLIALQYHEAELQFIMRPFRDLYTIIETNPQSPNYGYRVKPSPNVSSHGIENFLNNNSLAKTNQDGSRSLIRFDINPRLEVNYIFLDTDERKRFANVDHEYLIERVFRIETDGLSGGGSHNIKLELHHPTKEIIWTTRRDDTADHNDWSNFTNWTDEINPPYSLAYYNPYGETRTITSSNYNNYKNKAILEDAKILLNGFERFTERDAIFFNNAQPLETHTRIPKTGIYCYSFSLDNTNQKVNQPSGTCNFSMYNDIALLVKTNPIDSSENYKFIINIYAVSYNMLRITSGMGDLEFSP